MITKFHRGFTYLGLLFILAIMGITLAMAGTLWSFAQKRETERELIFVGNQFRQAIGAYYEKTPGVIKRYPQTLNQLLEDNRYVSMQRYLRRIYKDPVTLSQDWGIVTAPDGGIMGVYSKSSNQVIKTRNFQLSDLWLENKNKYFEWQFVYVPPQQIQTSVLRK